MSVFQVSSSDATISEVGRRDLRWQQFENEFLVLFHFLSFYRLLAPRDTHGDSSTSVIIVVSLSSSFVSSHAVEEVARVDTRKWRRERTIYNMPIRLHTYQLVQ